jgi:ferredoxin-type protein NapH
MKLPLIRRTVQVAFLCLLIAIPFLNEREMSFITGTLYSMSFGPVDVTDPLSGLQVIMLTMTATLTLIISMLIPIAFTLIFGRTFCGWLCPQNLFSELFDRFAAKLYPNRVTSLPPTPLPRWGVLAFVLIGSMVVGFPLASIISAPGIISLQISTAVFEGTFGLETTLIAFILLAEFFILRRFWCKYVCAVGTTLGFFRFGKTLKVVFSKDAERKCIQCGACSRACQFDLEPMEGNIYPMCHNCGDCIAACEQSTKDRNPLRFSF